MKRKEQEHVEMELGMHGVWAAQKEELKAAQEAEKAYWDAMDGHENVPWLEGLERQAAEAIAASRAVQANARETHELAQREASRV